MGRVDIARLGLRIKVDLEKIKGAFDRFHHPWQLGKWEVKLRRLIDLSYFSVMTI